MRKNNAMNYEKERKMNAIQKEELNNKCIDCKNENPEYISLNNAIFICKNCLKTHQKYSSNISRIIKNDLKLLTLKEVQYLYFGGNKKMLEFMKYEYPKLIKLDSSFVYKTIAMEYYRNWLSYLVEGGKKPIKPDIEVAYNSIEDRKYKNKNYSTNNNSDVITIDFINDCYNYNDKYNNTITNFINKKMPESKREDCENNNNNLDSNIKSRYQTDKGFYHKPPSTNLKDFLNYYKTINKNNYEKYINNQSNDFFSKTQTNFGNNKNRENNNIDNNNSNGRRKRNEIENNNINQVDNIIEDDNRNNYNSRILKAFKTNNRIYMKPKHTFMKSFEKEKEKEYNENKEMEEDKDIKFIMVKKDNKNDDNLKNVNDNNKCYYINNNGDCEIKDISNNYKLVYNSNPIQCVSYCGENLNEMGDFCYEGCIGENRIESGTSSKKCKCRYCT